MGSDEPFQAKFFISCIIDDFFTSISTSQCRMGQGGGKQQESAKGQGNVKAKSEQAVRMNGTQRYAEYVTYWEGESDEWPTITTAAFACPMGEPHDGLIGLASLLVLKDVKCLVVSLLDHTSQLSLRLVCRAFWLSQRDGIKPGVLDLCIFPVLLQGLKLALCTPPWPVTELIVDQMVLRVPGGLVGLEKVLNAHCKTLVRLELYAGPPWRCFEVRSFNGMSVFLFSCCVAVSDNASGGAFR